MPQCRVKLACNETIPTKCKYFIKFNLNGKISESAQVLCIHHHILRLKHVFPVLSSTVSLSLGPLDLVNGLKTIKDLSVYTLRVFFLLFFPGTQSLIIKEKSLLIQKQKLTRALLESWNSQHTSGNFSVVPRPIWELVGIVCGMGYCVFSLAHLWQIS